MEGNIVVSIAGILLSLGFGYLPGLRQWYEALDSIRKAQVMALCLILAAVGIFVAGCYTPWQKVTCDMAGAWGLVELLIFALIANQATYTLAVKPTRTPAERL